MEKHEQFKKGDLVVVIGMIEMRSGYAHKYNDLAEVLVVGKYDLFLMNVKETGFSYPTTYRASKKMCLKVKKKHMDIHFKIKEPKIGDLVVSYNKRSSKVEQHIGILEEINHTPGKPKMTKVRSGTQVHTIFYDDLIVAER